MLNGLLRKLLNSRNRYIYRAMEIPFGFDWCLDISYLLGTEVAVVTCFDVGANTGQTATRLVKAFPRADIFSFEPVPQTFGEMQSNVANMPNVRTYNIGFSDRLGQCTMRVADECGRNRIGADDGGKSVLVQLDTLDGFCDEHKIRELTVLKIDVEGHEMSVLRGATSLLQEKKVNYVLCECDFNANEDEPHGDFYEISAFMKSYDFRIISFYTGGVGEDGWVWGDVLFARADAIETKSVACSPLERSLHS